MCDDKRWMVHDVWYSLSILCNILKVNSMETERFSINRPVHASSFALQIIPPLYASKGHTIALEATMQSLVLDRRHPIALELAGTTERRSFIVRATSQVAIDNVEALLRAQYPQSEIRVLTREEDPLRLRDGEAITGVELVAGAAAFLPLRSWQEAQKEGSDPLLGLLAALGNIPEHTRVVAQLGLTPAISDWSRRYLRRAIEDPLSPEREAKQRRRMVNFFADGSSNVILLNIAMFAGLFLLARPYLPSWVGGAIVQVVLGKASQVPAGHISQLLFYVGCVLFLELCMIILYALMVFVIKRRSLYDPLVISQKVSRMAYRTRLRLYAIGPRDRGGERVEQNHWSGAKTQAKTRKELLLRTVAAYRQFHMANGAFFIPRRISNWEMRHLLSENAMGGAGWQRGLRQSHHIIGVDALAALWHMPHPDALPELALVEHRHARTLLISPEVTRECEGLPAIGYSEHAGYHLPFSLTPEFFTFHTLISGKAGDGKSVFLQHATQEAMRSGGVVLIDPFGDLCENVLTLVPPERAEDVVFIDLSDTIASVGVNPLDVTLGHQRDKFIADLLKMLAQIWASSWTARMENAFEMSLRTLFEANKILIDQGGQGGAVEQYTLLDILPLLTNANFCHGLLQQIQDDYLHRWWREYYEPLSLAQQRDVINPIAAKVAKFESVIARRILGQGRTTLDIPRMIQERKILLFKLARGIVGNEVASMIGATLLGLIQNTLEEQKQPLHAARSRLLLIINEFQRVAGADYRTLSELHEYGATFLLATQSLEYVQKINPLLWPTLQANVRQFVVFNMSAQDANLLYKELGVDQEDIIHLDINTCYVSVIVGGKRQPTFSLKLNAPVPSSLEQAEIIRTRCRVRYTNPVSEVDERLKKAMLRSIRVAPQTDPYEPKRQGERTEQTGRSEPIPEERQRFNEAEPMSFTIPPMEYVSGERWGREREYQERPRSVKIVEERGPQEKWFSAGEEEKSEVWMREKALLEEREMMEIAQSAEEDEGEERNLLD
jgi:hypothetical protein